MRTPVSRRVVLSALFAGVLLTGLPAFGALGEQLPLRRDAQPLAQASVWMPSLLVLVPALAVAGWALWKRGKLPGRWRPAQRPAAVLGRRSSQALTPHASVHVVEWQGQQYLIGCTPQQVTLLARSPAQQEPGEAVP